MSTLRGVILICDGCGVEETYIPDEDGRPPTKAGARESARAGGWMTGLRGTPERPSLYEARVDLCRDCSWAVEEGLK